MSVLYTSRTVIEISIASMSRWLTPMTLVKSARAGETGETLIQFDKLRNHMSQVNEEPSTPQLPFIKKICSNPLAREDKSKDSEFYSFPRFVTHIDDIAIDNLASFYRKHLKDGSIIVDLCSSWISHLPQDKKFSKVIGIGMNESELAANKNLNEHYVHDLNSPIHKDRLLPMLKDASVDHVICAVSIDYIIQPHHLFEEVLRILRPSSGSTFIISFSNRCFPTKVIRAWLQTDDVGRIGIVCSYFQETKQSVDNKWKHITVYDLSNEERDNHPSSPNYSDPLFVVMGEKA